MNLLGNHLLNFGNTLTMAVKSEKNLDVQQTRSGEIDKEQDEEDARDHNVLSIQTKQFSTVQQQSAKNDETSARKRNSFLQAIAGIGPVAQSKKIKAI